MRHRRLYTVSLLLIGLALAGIVGRVSAAEGRQGDECLVAADETIESDIYVACNTLTVAGVVEGDLIGGAWSAAIAPGGRVEGDIWLIGGQLRVEGTVADDIHFAGVDLDVTDSAQLSSNSDLAAVVLNVEVSSGATIPGDMLVLGYQAIVRGDVGRDLHFNGSALVIEGEVDSNVWAHVAGGDTSPSFIPFPFPFSVSFQTPGLTLAEGGRIGGDLSYTGPAVGSIEGVVGGEEDFTLVLPRPDITQAAAEDETFQPGELIVRYLSTVATDVLSLMAAGILVLAIAPAWMREPAAVVTRHTASSFGWGMILTLLAAPVSLILVLASILVLVLISVITLGGFTWMGLLLLVILNAVVIGGLAFVVLFLARLVISDLIGRRIGRRLLRTTDRWIVNLVSLFIGTLVYALLTNVPLPWIGLLINAAGIFIGLGAVALHARQLYQRVSRAPLFAAAESTRDGSAPQPRRLEALLGNTPAPPPESTELPGPGMTNLPEGFQWWVADEQEPRHKQPPR